MADSDEPQGDELGLTPLTMGALLDAAREAGWVVTVTTNLHFDRPDRSGGTGDVLVECFDEYGNPALWLPGTDREGHVQVGGNKFIASNDDTDFMVSGTVEGTMAWVEVAWDRPDDPISPAGGDRP